MNAEQQERMDTERQDRIITECDKYSDRMRHRMIETFSTDEMEEMLGGLAVEAGYASFNEWVHKNGGGMILADAIDLIVDEIYYDESLPNADYPQATSQTGAK